ncbi:hypothetical protein I4P18_19255 [Enterobacter roggenkampii]|nr:hypothetical protein [Enterobacter roggenkampii]
MISDEWAYAVMDHFGTYGIAELEETLVDIASMFGLLPAILTGFFSKKSSKKKVIYEPSGLASKAFLTRKSKTPKVGYPTFGVHFISVVTP